MQKIWAVISFLSARACVCYSHSSYSRKSQPHNQQRAAVWNGAWQPAVWQCRLADMAEHKSSNMLFSLILPQHITASLCVHISFFLTRHAVTFHLPSLASPPSLIFSLWLHNSGDQSPVAMAVIPPPMQVHVRVQLSLCMFVYVWCVFELYLLRSSSQSAEASACDAALLHCPCMRSSFDSCLLKMLSPATLGFLSAPCRIMTELKGERDTYTPLSALFCLSLG